MPFVRYTPTWTDWSGGPGYSVFHFDLPGGVGSATDCANAVRAMFEAIKSYIPAAININFPGEMTIHADDGTLTGTQVVSPAPAMVDCAGASVYSAASGARITWETAGIVAGRRVRGRTFLVPLVATVYDSDGTLASAFRTNLQTAATNMLGALTTAGQNLVVWSPTTSTIHDVGSATIPDQATVLRSRRA